MTLSAACAFSVAFHNRSRSTGKERDSESGNDYFGARYYASSVGRFMSPDWSAQVDPVPYAKLGNPQSLNLYAYVLNNPTTGIDPSRHNRSWDRWWSGRSSDDGNLEANEQSAEAAYVLLPTEMCSAERSSLCIKRTGASVG